MSLKLSTPVEKCKPSGELGQLHERDSVAVPAAGPRGARRRTGWLWLDQGASHIQAQWDAAIQQQALQTAAARERQAQATVKVVTEYVDRVRVVRAKGDTSIKKVPVYVPVQADAACTINRGFVRLHDAPAAGELPEPARDADAAAAGIALSAVAGTVAAYYQTGHENAEQLRELQVCIVEMTANIR
jgi:hypothetical protein